MLDSDVILMQQPDKFFESELYTKSSNLFWPDFWMHRHLLEDRLKFLGINNYIYDILNLTRLDPANNWISSTESGVVVINR